MVSPIQFNPLGHDTPGPDLMALDLLAKRSKDLRYGSGLVEVGAWAGLTSQVLHRHLVSGEILYCVDHWKGSPNEPPKAISPEHALLTFSKNTESWGGRIGRDVMPCVGDSRLWAEIFSQADRKFRMVFIDADHDAEAVRNDILAWWPLVEHGGIICGHDYGVFPGVGKAVEFTFNAKHVVCGLTIWAVEKCSTADAISMGYRINRMSMEKMQ